MDRTGAWQPRGVLGRAASAWGLSARGPSIGGSSIRGSAAGRFVARACAVLACAVLLGLTAAPARAQIGSDRYAALVMEARTGAILLSASADARRYPASLTKIMTVYMAFEAIRDGRTGLSTRIPVSARAAAMPPSKLGLPPGSSLTVEEAILALVTKSANDAAVTLGEHLGGGSEERFAQLMTLRARALGMSRTTFRNASGLPDLDQVSTARDMVTLGRRMMQDFPRQYAYFSTPHFVFRGRTHWNHNRLLQEYEGTDGIKTGYINDSGFNLLASSERDGVRLIAAVFGGKTGRERDRHMMAILDQGFAQMGVAPREAQGSALVSAARAAAPRARAPTRVAIRPPVPRARATTARAPARSVTVLRGRAAPPRAQAKRTVRSTTTTRRVEQGDTGRSVQSSTPSRSARTTATARSAAAKSAAARSTSARAKTTARPTTTRATTTRAATTPQRQKQGTAAARAAAKRGTTR